MPISKCSILRTSPRLLSDLLSQVSREFLCEFARNMLHCIIPIVILSSVCCNGRLELRHFCFQYILICYDNSLQMFVFLCLCLFPCLVLCVLVDSNKSLTNWVTLFVNVIMTRCCCCIKFHSTGHKQYALSPDAGVILLETNKP